MRDDKEQRIYGPYEHGQRYRVHIVTGRGGARKTRYRTFATRALADAYVAGAQTQAQGITVSAAINAFLDAKRVQGRAELTITTYRQRLETLLAMFLHRPLRAVAQRGAELYAATIPRHSADYHQNMLAVGRIWAKWCIKRRWLRASPFADVEPVGQRVLGADKARLTVDESRRLEAWCLARRDQDAALTLGYLYLGPRCSELAQRSVRDLDDGGSLLWIGKTKSAAGRRKLRVPPELGELLLELCAGRAADAPIFVDANGNRMNRNVARKRVRWVCDMAGVPVLPPQALRRTQASLATEAGETALAVARHLGHSTGAAPKVTTQAYIERDAAVAAQGERAFRVIRGGRA
jgi:integrase